MEIRQEIKRRAADIEARIAPFLPQEKGFQQTVLDAMDTVFLQAESVCGRC